MIAGDVKPFQEVAGGLTGKIYPLLPEKIRINSK
jgi:hypothetical protein